MSNVNIMNTGKRGKAHFLYEAVIVEEQKSFFSGQRREEFAL